MRTLSAALDVALWLAGVAVGGAVGFVLTRELRKRWARDASSRKTPRPVPEPGTGQSFSPGGECIDISQKPIGGPAQVPVAVPLDRSTSMTQRRPPTIQLKAVELARQAKRRSPLSNQWQLVGTRASQP